MSVVRDGWLYFSSTTSGEDGAIVHPKHCRANRLHPGAHGRDPEAAGCTYADVVMTTDYITTTDGYHETGAVRKKYFKEPYPASTGVIVATLLRPGALVEIDAVAKVPEK